MTTDQLVCDGCRQLASAEHTAQRLKRLEWTTRWRPIHIGTLLLGTASPKSDDHFLYAGKFGGEAELALKEAGVSASGKTAEATLAEFQRGGFFLTHILECPVERESAGQASIEQPLQQRISFVAARIRRSLKPKRIVLISELPWAVAEALANAGLGCPILLRDGQTLASHISLAANAAKVAQDG